ncbi:MULTISPECIES: aromatic ring-hydroxylating dioxygenase subunit alpha [unclassified Peribacillus]|uniref:aromatic ring-hydroxylating oxygenase subunit alpha n=1 Tax=unclassified Peribacillus TaxID=2675266 RepID=UPI001911C8DA|nr:MULTISPECIES: SRPBCC family protein [unclassified Peribacillus]MBK5445069.1 Rieske 2Fe-2S domain-containing protein [Peribacillus sp. TH24]WMX56488.1 SRPBCC family protein [Peribacillus sp. R9-11]
MSTKEDMKKLEYTLPYNQYVDPEVMKGERENIFYKNWIMVGHTSQVEKVGDFFTFDLVGEPIIVTRGKDEELRAFYNICPHRGAMVERTEQGNKKILQCMYHGWTFHLDGKVNRTPNFKTNDIEKPSCMTSIRLEVHQSMIFVNLDQDASSFETDYQSFLNNIKEYTFLSSLKKVRENRRIVLANWKSIIDNYLECDHCQIAHPSFSKAFDLTKYSITPCDNFSYQCTTASDEEEGSGARFYWVWPNTMISIYPGTGNMTTSHIIPVDEKSSLAIYRYYFADEKLTEDEEDLIKFVDQVREEDFELVELLQSGLHSKACGRGVYSPTEHGLKHFHQLVTKAMQS